MHSRTSTPAASHGTGDLRIDSYACVIKQETACILAVLRRPACAGSVLSLALIFSVIASLRFSWTPRLWWLIPILTALSLIIVLDLRTKFIPDLITLPGILYGLIDAALFGNSSPAGAALGALAAGGIVLLVAVISQGAVGGGDIKLMALLGAALGWQGALTVLAFSQIAAAFVGLGLLIAAGVRRHDTLPVGAIISFFGAIMLLGAP
jgi:leader peptidase (prepilin peptidase)/N-methyltransferase